MPDKQPVFRPGRPPVYEIPSTGIVPFRASYKSHRDCGDHWHSELEIFYLMSGSGSLTIFVEGTPYCLSERDMLIIPSTAVHRIEVSDKENKVLRLDIGYPLLGENFRAFTERRFTSLFHSFSKEPASSLSKIEPIFHAISREKLAMSEEHQDDTDTETVISRMRVSSYLIQIAAILLENLPSAPLPDSVSKKRHALHTIQSVVFYIQSHYHEPITLEKAADMAGYEKTHFCQLFKEFTGTTFLQYLTNRRLTEALPLLRETALPIASIAQSVGIPNVKTFYRLMRSHFGLSPNAIRKGIGCEDDAGGD